MLANLVDMRGVGMTLPVAYLTLGMRVYNPPSFSSTATTQPTTEVTSRYWWQRIIAGVDSHLTLHSLAILQSTVGAYTEKDAQACA